VATDISKIQLVESKKGGDVRDIYVEDGHKMKRFFMPDDVYEQPIRGHIIVCTDSVIVDRVKKTFWLAPRQAKPMSGGPWVIGGRRPAGVMPRQNARGTFRRETGLDLPEERFVPTAIHKEYIWKDREQEPQDVGCHNFVDIFAIELSGDEHAAASGQLEDKEYASGGLREYDRGALVAVGNPILIDLYDEMFMLPQSPARHAYACRAALFSIFQYTSSCLPTSKNKDDIDKKSRTAQQADAV